MIDLLRSIIDVIVSLVGFLIHSVESLISFFAHIPAYTSFLVSSINVLPSVIIPFAIASISLYVMLLVVGRN